MITLDTNILFYAVDSEGGDRHRQAKQILASLDPRDSFLAMQTLGELCFSVSRKRPNRLASAHQIVQKLGRTFDVIPAAAADLDEAIRAHQAHALPFWDAMLWATAKRAGCRMLLTEDFQDGRSLEGVTFRNPFRMKAAELDAIFSER